MGTLLAMILCAVMMGEQRMAVQSFVFSTRDTALTFSQCILDKMSESQFFTTDDVNSMVEVQNVMAEAMSSSRQNMVRILLIAFVTSLAEVVIHDDPTVNTYRQGTYVEALEQCSSYSTGYVDHDFISEAVRILYALERNKKMQRFKENSSGEVQISRETHGTNPNLQTSGTFYPPPVQPSPVQIQPDSFFYNPDDKTVSGTPDTSYSSAFSTSFANPPSEVQYSGSDGIPSATGGITVEQSGGFPRGSGAAVISQPSGFLPQSHDRDMLQSERHSPDYDASSVSQSETFMSSSDSLSGSFRLDPGSQPGTLSSSSDTSDVSQSGDGTGGNVQSDNVPLGVLMIPQTKESSVRVIPPEANQQFTQGEYLPQNPPVETGSIYQPSTVGGVRQPEGSVYPMTHSSSIQQSQYSNISPDPVLENIVLNILTNSEIFKDSFYSGIPQENAINLARAVTEQSLNGYSFDLIKDALTAVSAEIGKVTYSSPENYALALSNALVHILKLHNLPLPIDGSGVATSVLSNLSKLSRQAESFAEESMYHSTNETYDYELNQKQPDFDFQNPPLSPEDTDEEIFSEILARLLSNSDTISNFFCSSADPQYTVQMSFSIIKSSLVQYSQRVSALAASLATGALGELSKEELCFQYAKTISEAIADVLDESAIHTTNAEDISNEMALAISKWRNTTTESASDTIPSISIETEPYETVPILQSSFSENFKDSKHDDDTFSSAFYHSTQDSISHFSESIMLEASSNFPGGTVESTSSAPSQIQPIKEINTDYQPIIEYQDSVPTSPYSEFSDSFTSAGIFVETAARLLDTNATENPVKWAPDGIIDQEALADYLFDSLKSVLGEESEPEPSSASPKEIPISTESLKNIDFENDKPKTLSESSTSESRERTRSRNHQNTRRRKKKRKNPALSTTLTPSVHPFGHQEDLENGNPGDEDVKIENSPLGTGSESISDYSTDTPVKISPVELMPSFYVPPSSSEDASSTAEVQLDSDIEYNDTLVAFAKEISRAAESSIDFIHSQNFDMANLCAKINEFAPLVDIPPLEYCEEIASIDYLLNVLRSAIKIFKGV